MRSSFGVLSLFFAAAVGSAASYAEAPPQGRSNATNAEAPPQGRSNATYAEPQARKVRLRFEYTPGMNKRITDLRLVVTLTSKLDSGLSPRTITVAVKNMKQTTTELGGGTGALTDSKGREHAVSYTVSVVDTNKFDVFLTARDVTENRIDLRFEALNYSDSWWDSKWNGTRTLPLFTFQDIVAHSFRGRDTNGDLVLNQAHVAPGANGVPDLTMFEMDGKGIFYITLEGDAVADMTIPNFHRGP